MADTTRQLHRDLELQPDGVSRVLLTAGALSSLVLLLSPVLWHNDVIVSSGAPSDLVLIATILGLGAMLLGPVVRDTGLPMLAGIVSGLAVVGLVAALPIIDETCDASICAPVSLLSFHISGVRPTAGVGAALAVLVVVILMATTDTEQQVLRRVAVLAGGASLLGGLAGSIQLQDPSVDPVSALMVTGVNLAMFAAAVLTARRALDTGEPLLSVVRRHAATLLVVAGFGAALAATFGPWTVATAPGYTCGYAPGLSYDDGSDLGYSAYDDCAGKPGYQLTADGDYVLITKSHASGTALLAVAVMSVCAGGAFLSSVARGRERRPLAAVVAIAGGSVLVGNRNVGGTRLIEIILPGVDPSATLITGVLLLVVAVLIALPRHIDTAMFAALCTAAAVAGGVALTHLQMPNVDYGGSRGMGWGIAGLGIAIVVLGAAGVRGAHVMARPELRPD